MVRKHSAGKSAQLRRSDGLGLGTTTANKVRRTMDLSEGLTRVRERRARTRFTPFRTTPHLC